MVVRVGRLRRATPPTKGMDQRASLDKSRRGSDESQVNGGFSMLENPVFEGDDDHEGSQIGSFSSEKYPDIKPEEPKTDIPKYTPESMGLFTLDNPVRQFCIWVIEHPWFENIIILLIMTNCFILAQMDPTKGSESPRNQMVDLCEPFFIFLFSIEMVFKIMAMGLWIGPQCYLRDGWNVMDFTIVMVSLLTTSMLASTANVSAVRTLRVLRPLRTLSVLPGMKGLINTMLNALPMLGNVILLSLFLFVVFGILGIQLFKGTLRNRCFWVYQGDDEEEPVVILLDSQAEEMCTNHSYPWRGRSCDAKEGFYCLPHENPNYGVTSFDNIIVAFLTIFQCITLEGWTSVMYHTQDSTSGWAFVYFLLLIFLGGFFLINLALAVVTETYGDESHDEPEQEDLDDASSKKSNDEKLEVLEESDDEGGAAAKGGISSLCLWIVDQHWFNPLVTIIIVVNTVLLSVEYDGMSEEYSRSLSQVNLVLTIFFVVEMIMKMTAYGFKEYTSSRLNNFDAFVATVSVFELMVANSGSLSVLRTVRILRILKLAKSWTTLNRFLVTMYWTVCSLGNFMVIVTITIFIFSLLGMQMFGGNFSHPDVFEERPRHHFDDLLTAVVTVFQLLTGEDWNQVMYDGIAATNGWAALYFIATIVIGNYLVLNLFVAILLTNFAGHNVRDDVDVLVRRIDRMNDFRNRMGTNMSSVYMDMMQIEDTHVYDDKVLEKWARVVERLTTEGRRPQENQKKRRQKRGSIAHRMSTIIMDPIKDSEFVEKIAVIKRRHKWNGNAPRPLDQYTNKTFFLFSNDHPIRQFVHGIIDDRRFDWLIMGLIVLSSSLMAWEHPGQDEGDRMILFWADIIFSIVFIMEMLMKILAFGLVSEEDTYLRDTWNVLDMVIVALGIISLVLSNSNFGWVRSLRTMRVLRPLRVINHVPELKIVVNTLFRSIPELGNVLVVSLLCWLVFGILGMQLFMGKFHWCNDGDVYHREDCVGTYEVMEVSFRKWEGGQLPEEGGSCNDPTILDPRECYGIFDETVEAEREWEKSDMNFDNILKAMQTLLEMSTTEGWTAVMYDGMDVTGRSTALVRDSHPLYALFFLVFMVVGNFLILNLFVGIILDNFTQLSGEEDRKMDGMNEFMTKDQRAWVQTHTKIVTMSAKKKFVEPEARWRKFLFDIVTSDEFDWVMIVGIVLNATFMAMEHYNMSPYFTNLIESCNTTFTILFTIEAALKLVALGWREYFSEAWNMFDFVVVTISLVGLMVGAVSPDATGGGGGASVLRILRIARLFRVARSLHGLRMLFETLIISLPSLGNVGGLMLLLSIVYAILGVNLFGKVKYGENLNRHSNFRTFGAAMLTLMRTATGEAWNSIMYDAMITSDCDSSDDCALGECCGSPAAAVVYFVSYTVMGGFVMLNLLIAVVLENFSTTKKADAKKVTKEDLKHFGEVWKRFDPLATNIIPLDRFSSLVCQLHAPLGLMDQEGSHHGHEVSKGSLLKFQNECQLSVEMHEGIAFLDYHSVLRCLTLRAMGVVWSDLPQETRLVLQASHEKTVKKTERTLDRKLMSMVGSGGDGSDGDNKTSHSGGGGGGGKDKWSKAGHTISIKLVCSKVIDNTARKEGDPVVDEGFTIAQLYAVKLLQAATRGFLERKRVRLLKAQQEEEARVQKAIEVVEHIQELFVDAVDMKDEFFERSDPAMARWLRRQQRESHQLSEKSSRNSTPKASWHNSSRKNSLVEYPEDPAVNVKR